MFEHPQREIVNVISKSRFTPTDTPMPAAVQQLAIAVRSQRMNFVRDTGSDSNLSVALDPPLTNYTLGLELHVLIANTNTSDVVRINAGAGTVPVRKMNGAEVGAGQLPQGALATLVYDGAIFQLSNFGGVAAGGPPEIFQVKIPYTVDHSLPADHTSTQSTYRANFTPPITDLTAGDIIAVKLMHTNGGPITIVINENITGGLPRSMLPNGGKSAPALQGDVAEGDVMVLFYDGSNFWFTPNPEITAHVEYRIGLSQQFLSLADAMAALRRKTIGASGYVTLRFIADIFDGGLDIEHPSADRLAIRGTMTTAPPMNVNFFRSGNTAAWRDSDAVNNLAMLRSRYGTEIRVANTSGAYGIQNVGPGRPLIADLLITGTRNPALSFQHGVINSVTSAISLRNVTCASLTNGFVNNGGMWANNCYACGCVHHGFWATGDEWLNFCGSFGNSTGHYCQFSRTWLHFCVANNNGGYGYASSDGSNLMMWYPYAVGNLLQDVIAYSASSIQIATPATYHVMSPAPVGTAGNSLSIITEGHSSAGYTPPPGWP